MKIYAFVLILTLSVFSNELSLSLGGGFNNTYGTGVEIQKRIIDDLHLNTGIGFFIDGFKVGLGCRYYFLNTKRLNPLLESSFSYNTGFPKMDATINGDDISLKTSSGFNCNIGTGVRWNIFEILALHWSLGFFLPVGKSYSLEYYSSEETKKKLDRLVNPGLYFCGYAQFSFGK